MIVPSETFERSRLGATTARQWALNEKAWLRGSVFYTAYRRESLILVTRLRLDFWLLYYVLDRVAGSQLMAERGRNYIPCPSRDTT